MRLKAYYYTSWGLESSAGLYFTKDIESLARQNRLVAGGELKQNTVI